jgi:hypothetical protein
MMWADSTQALSEIGLAGKLTGRAAVTIFFAGSDKCRPSRQCRSGSKAIEDYPLRIAK